MNGGRTFRDIIFAPLLCAGVAALAWFWRFDAPPPDLLEDLAAAAGLRPPASPLSLHWHGLVAPLIRSLGLPAAESVLRGAGHVSLGVFAAFAYAIFFLVLPPQFVRGGHVAEWWRFAVRFVIAQGVVLLCCSDPVWRAFRWFSPLALQLVEAEVAALLFLVHLRTGRRFVLHIAFWLLGVLAADAPLGALLTAVAVAALGLIRVLRSSGVLLAPEENPLLGIRTRSWLTLVFLSGLAAGVAAEASAFADMDGLAAFGWDWGDYALELPFVCLRRAVSVCSPIGAVLFAIVAVGPVLVASVLVFRAIDEEHPLSYFHGTLFAVFGIVALSQLSGAKVLWFWTWTDGDGAFRCVGAFLCAISAVWSLAVFTSELYLRNFRRLATLRFPDAAEEADGAAAVERTRLVQRRIRSCLLVAEPVLALACSLPFRVQRVERAMHGVVADAVRETARECEGAEFLFTDGGLDAAVEVAAVAQGRRLVALSMMGGADDRRDIYLRTRGVTNAADKALLESGAADALRTWVRERPDKARDYAVQIGFELWQRDGKPLPKCSGLVARPAGLSPAEAVRGAEAARTLARRIIAICDAWDPDGISDLALRDVFYFTQWRLAVLARHRANERDEDGDSAAAVEDTRLADELDRRNAALGRVRATMSWASRRKLERMTPQEGLQIELAHADFARARLFALRVLDVTPDDPEANFALGMDYFVQRQYARAEFYLSQCLKRRPDDPAVLNNLAQCRLRQDDPEGALPYARRALEILPDSPEVKRTAERVEAGLKATDR